MPVARQMPETGLFPEPLGSLAFTHSGRDSSPPRVAKGSASPGASREPVPGAGRAAGMFRDRPALRPPPPGQARCGRQAGFVPPPSVACGAERGAGAGLGGASSLDGASPAAGCQQGRPSPAGCPRARLGAAGRFQPPGLSRLAEGRVWGCALEGAGQGKRVDPVSFPVPRQVSHHQGLCQALAGPRLGPETHGLGSGGPFFAVWLQSAVKPVKNSQPVHREAHAAEAELLGCAHTASLLWGSAVVPALEQPFLLA